MRLKITSGGSLLNTHIVDVETGRELENVSAVRFEVDRENDCLARVTLTLELVPVELEGDVREMVTHDG